MQILDALWFSQYGHVTQIGIVIGKDTITEELKCYIGHSPFADEKKDREYIAQTGAKFPLEAARILFPNHFPKDE